MNLLKSWKILSCLCLLLFACQQKHNPALTDDAARNAYIEEHKAAIHLLLDSLNIAASNADFELYFSYYTDDAHFLGTDATENWDKKSFMKFAKPYFDRGKAWSFNSIDRNIYFAESTDLAWFDELLSTQMKLCRGSGVVVKQDGQWKIKHYVLSMTIPNDEVEPIVKIKSVIEDSLMLVLTKNN